MYFSKLTRHSQYSSNETTLVTVIPQCNLFHVHDIVYNICRYFVSTENKLLHAMLVNVVIAGCVYTSRNTVMMMTCLVYIVIIIMESTLTAL